MRDAEIYNLINQAMQKVSAGVAGTIIRMGQEIDELRAHLTAETIRRQVLEDLLFDATLPKDKYEEKYKAAIEEYDKKVQEAMEAAEKAAQEAAEQAKTAIVTPKRTLVGPDGAVLPGAGNGPSL